jgi:hypothetical protein
LEEENAILKMKNSQELVEAQDRIRSQGEELEQAMQQIAEHQS